MKNIGNDPRSLFNGNHFSSKYICRYVVCLSYVKLTALAELRTAHAHAQSLFLAVKPGTPVLFISYKLEL